MTPNAQSNLGLMYATGNGVSENVAEAIRWYRLAAEQGHVRARHNLGFMYARGGEGVPRDYAEAVRWFRLAAEEGDTSAMGSTLVDLGFMYLGGRRVPQDAAYAARWFLLAAEEGDASAQSVLGEHVRHWARRVGG